MDKGQIRARLDALTWQMLLIFQERLALVNEMARQKLKLGEPIHAPDREAAIFGKVVDGCNILGLDPNYVLEIVSLMIAHAKDAEAAHLKLPTFMDTRPVAREELVKNLLRLTTAAAEGYSDDYCSGQGTDAIRSHRRRERELLRESIDACPHKLLAVDLGCADGQIPEMLEQPFHRVRGFDLCPAMIKRAQTRIKWPEHVGFETADLNECIPVEDGSVSFAVANFGAASEVSDHLFPELARVLTKGGKAFLSFYNTQAISSMWYYPWPSTVRAHHNGHNNTLEVWYGDQVYVIPGAGMTAEGLLQACNPHKLTVEWIDTFPTFLSLMPRFVFGSEQYQGLVKGVEAADVALARQQTPQGGTYLTALIRK